MKNSTLKNKQKSMAGFWVLFSILFTVRIFAAEQRIIAADGHEYRRFGFSVAVNNGFIAVGSPGTLIDVENRGTVYIYRDSLGIWVEHAQLAADDPLPFDLFGHSLSSYKNQLLVGSQGDSAYNRLSGAAYLFERIDGVYQQTAIFRSPALVPKDQFGCSVALSESLCVIGAPADGGLLPASGSVYVYKPNPTVAGAWQFDAKLFPSDGKYFNHFGAAVAVSGKRIIIGAPYATSPQKNAGDAYVFEKRNGKWKQSAKLSPSDGNFRNMFGSAVAIDGDFAAVGAYRDDVGDFDTGSVYVYRFADNQWLQDAKLVAADADSGDFFGYSISLYKNYLVVGAPGDNGNGADAGSVYAFLRDEQGWSQKTKKSANDQAFKDKFGTAVAVGKDITVVGAPHKKVKDQVSQGAAYVYGNIDDLALPVTLTAFAAEYADGKIILTWTTQSEIDNLGFIIQKRTAESEWQTIADFNSRAELLGRGSASTPADYRFVDDQIVRGEHYFYRLGDVNIGGVVTFHPEISVTITVVSDLQSLPNAFALFPAYPNPFNPQTTLRYYLPRNVDAVVAVYDMRGRRVRTLADMPHFAGEHSVVWDGRDDGGQLQSSGVYLIRLTAENVSLAAKVILLD